MKRTVVAIVIALALSLTGSRARAETTSAAPDDYDDSQSHPLRIAAYLIHPLGFTAEWLIFRPLHRLVSQPGAANVFGHRDHADDATIGAAEY